MPRYVVSDDDLKTWKSGSRDLAKKGDRDTLIAKPRSGGAAGPAIKDADGLFAFMKDAPDAALEVAMDRIAKGSGGPIVPFVVSDQSKDRDGDTVSATGWNLSEHQRNPVMLFGHMHDLPAIGNGLGTFVTPGGEVKSVGFFTAADVNPFGHMIGRMAEENVLRATSVGFIPMEWQYQDDESMGVDFTKQELIEWSVVNVGSNRNALAQARSFVSPEGLAAARAKGIDVAPMIALVEKALDGEGLTVIKRSDLEALRASVVVRQVVVDGARSVKEDREAARKEVKRAISYDSAHSGGTSKAPKEEAWDGPAEVGAASIDDLKIMSAWVDEGAADTKTAYKLPHHHAAGEHSVVWRGVAAAMGALLGSRGGVDIPEADKQGVYDHLAKHYRDFEEEPPELRSYTEEEARAIADAPEPKSVVDWRSVAVELGKRAGSYEFKRARRANTYAKSETDEMDEASLATDAVLAEIDATPEEHADESANVDGGETLSEDGPDLDVRALVEQALAGGLGKLRADLLGA